MSAIIVKASVPLSKSALANVGVPILVSNVDGSLLARESPSKDQPLLYWKDQLGHQGFQPPPPQPPESPSLILPSNLSYVTIFFYKVIIL